MNAEKTLVLAVEMEKKAANIYDTFSKIFQENESARAMWQKQARLREEQVILAEAEVLRLKAMSRTFWDTLLEIDVIKDTLEYLEKTEVCLHGSETSLEEAVDVGVRIDERIKKSYETLMKKASPALKKVFIALTGVYRCDGRLEDYAGELGTNGRSITGRKPKRA